MMTSLWLRPALVMMVLFLLIVGSAALVSAQAPLPPRPVAEVPEADTLVLVAGGIGGAAMWLGWEWRKVKSKRR